MIAHKDFGAQARAGSNPTCLSLPGGATLGKSLHLSTSLALFLVCKMESNEPTSQGCWFEQNHGKHLELRQTRQLCKQLILSSY